MKSRVDERGYRTFAQIAPYLGFHGKRAAGAARKWVLRNQVPKKWRGGAWVISLADVDRVLEGESFKRITAVAA